MRFVSGPDFSRSVKINGAQRLPRFGRFARQTWHADATEPHAFFPPPNTPRYLRTADPSESPCLPIAKEPTLTTGKLCPRQTRAELFSCMANCPRPCLLSPPYCTVSVKVTVWLRLPAVPVTLTLVVPGGVVAPPPLLRSRTTEQISTKIQSTANCQNSNCLTPGVHRKNCQEAHLRTEVMTPHSKPLPPQYPQRYLAGFRAELGILIIGGKEIILPLLQF
jgi:hypothetical protein